MNNTTFVLTESEWSLLPTQTFTARPRSITPKPRVNRPLATVAGGLVSVLLSAQHAAVAQESSSKAFVSPTVFQAAGPTADSIRSSVDAFRAVPGFETVNGNNSGPLQSGRREINWDGGNP